MGLYIAFVFISTLFIITFLWLSYTLRSRFNILTYTILLLLDDDIQNQQKSELKKWMKQQEFNSEADLQRRTRFIITQLAQSFAQKNKSLELASSMLWRINEK